ncbi:MAG: hypothetical protein U0234_12710 [Sandaracinus sp.]
MLRTMESVDLDAGTAIHVAAAPDRFWVSSWDQALSFGAGGIVGVRRQKLGDVSVPRLTAIRVGRSLERVASYLVDAGVPCGDLDTDGDFVFAERTHPREPRGALALRAVGRGGSRAVSLGDVGGWPVALRVTGRDRALLWLASEESEMCLVDLRDGRFLHRVFIEADGASASMIELTASGGAVALGHGGCQEHTMELLDVGADHLIDRDWAVFAPEGLCVLGADASTLVTVEHGSTAVVRCRDRATGEVLVERADALRASFYVPPGHRDARGWLVSTRGRHGADAVVRIRAEDLAVEEVGRLPPDVQLYGWPQPGVALVADSQRASLVRVE